jgi:hypothetical protein
MSFRILYPGISVPLMVDAENFTDAAKKMIKLNQHLNITEMMIRDQANNQMFANINYMNDNNRRRASINMKSTRRYASGRDSNYNPYMDGPMMGGPMMGPMVVIGGVPAAAPAAAPAATPAVPAAAPATPVATSGLLGRAAAAIGLGAPAATPAAATPAAAAPAAAAPAPAAPVMRVVMPGTNQLVPVNFGMVGTNGLPISGVPVPFGLGAYPGGPGVVVGGPMGIASPVRFGPGLGRLDRYGNY